MAKNIEIGFILPKDFLIEKSSNVASMYTDEESQIIRFKEGYIQANTNKQEGNIKITFLKAGKHKINAFIKAENVKNRRFDFYIDVVE